jgi:hypothetical protein
MWARRVRAGAELGATPGSRAPRGALRPSRRLSHPARTGRLIGLFIGRVMRILPNRNPSFSTKTGGWLPVLVWVGRAEVGHARR